MGEHDAAHARDAAHDQPRAAGPQLGELRDADDYGGDHRGHTRLIGQRPECRLVWMATLVTIVDFTAL